MAFQLEPDIVKCILTWIPDFESLTSVVLTSKAIYDVYRAHSALAHRGVANNLLGPALPHALRYIRCNRNCLENRPVREFLAENQLQNSYPLSNDDIRGLAKIASQIQELEDIFSWREKNNQFRTTRLSAAESYRFRRALLRMCLLACLHATTSHRHDNETEDRIREMQRQFFDALPTPELKEIKRLNTFLGRLAQWASNAYSFTKIGGSYLSLLDMFLGAYSGKLSQPAADMYDIPQGLNDFLFLALDDVLLSRNLRKDIAEETILDQAPVDIFECYHCHSKLLRKFLWGPTDWECLRGYVNPDCMRSFLKGRLSGYIREADTFHDVWRKHPYDLLISEVFYHTNTPYEFLLCMECLCRFLSDHLHKWYIVWKRKHALPLQTSDCWYGYNCRTQTTNPSHAATLNHWCEPTCGDPVPSIAKPPFKAEF